MRPWRHQQHNTVAATAPDDPYASFDGPASEVERVDGSEIDQQESDVQQDGLEDEGERTEDSGVAVNRVQLARALIEYDEEPTAHTPSSKALQSAILSPFRHILQHPPPPQPVTEDEPFHSSVPDTDHDRPTSALELYGMSPDGASRKTEAEGFREDLQRRYSRSLAGSRMGLNAPDLQADEQDEERLAEDWGLADVMTRVGSEAGSPKSPGITFPSFSGAASPDLETRSLPDLLHGRTLSTFSAASTSAVEASIEKGPRLRVLERPAGFRNRTQSLGATVALDLPTFDSLLSPDELEAGPRSSSSLGFSSRPFSPVGTISHHSPFAADSRPLSGISVTDVPTRDRAPSTLSFYTPAADRAERERPTTMFSTNSGGRPMSMLSAAPTTFTSRFDPAVIARHKEELEADRPVFKNKDGGLPPQVVLMPAPLAGQPQRPFKKPKPEGPEADEQPADRETPPEEQRYDENGEPIVNDKPRRPPGALYGRSLMDVLAERKALNHGQAKQHDSQADGRRPMADWGNTPAALALMKAQAQAQALGGGSAGGSENSHDFAPPKPAHLPRSVSVFGVDPFFAKDMQKRMAEEEAERVAKEQEEQRLAAMEAKEQAKHTRKLQKKGKHAAREETIRKLEGSGDLSASPLTSQPRRRTMLEQDSDLTPKKAAHTHAAAPSLSLPLVMATSDFEAEQWFPPTPDPVQRRAPSPGSTRSTPRRATKPAPDAELERKAAELRASVMLGTFSPAEAVIKSWHLGLDPRAIDTPTGLTPSTSPVPRLAKELPELNVNNHDSLEAGLADLMSPTSGDADEDDDDRPLGLRYTKPSDSALDDDDDDAPLGLKVSSRTPPTTSAEEDDDQPLGLSSAALEAQQRQSMMYLQAQQQVAAQQMMYQQASYSSMLASPMVYPQFGGHAGVQYGQGGGPQMYNGQMYA